MESIGTYWIPLKLSMLSFLNQEVDKVIKKFFSWLTSFVGNGTRREQRSVEVFRVA